MSGIVDSLAALDDSPPTSVVDAIPEAPPEPAEATRGPLSHVKLAAAYLMARGAGVAEIARQVGRSPATVSAWLKDKSFLAQYAQYQTQFGIVPIRDRMQAGGAIAASVVEDLMLHDKDSGVRLRAALAMLEHGWGKPTQRIEHTEVVNDAPTALAELDAKLAELEARVETRASGRLGGEKRIIEGQLVDTERDGSGALVPNDSVAPGSSDTEGI